MTDLGTRNGGMLRRHLEARGVRGEALIAAVEAVPRETFLPAHLAHAASSDAPLEIAMGHVAPPPGVVAEMIEALDLRGGEKVLEIGAGTGYPAALLSHLAAEVFLIERHGELAAKAAAALQDAGCSNVRVLHDEGTHGWDEEAPFDAILVSGAVPEVPETLKSRLAPGGRMVAAVGPDARSQELVRVTRHSNGRFVQEDIADVRFVPPLGDQHIEGEPPPREAPAHRPRAERDLPALIRAHGEPFDTIEDAPLDGLIERIRDARVVLIGEASHGTREFYALRARITRRLIEQKGFDIVAAEADWPDAARIDHYVRHREAPPSDWEAFARFPTWMWRNEEVRAFADWLHDWNAKRPEEARTGFYGLDLYSLFTSAQATIDYLADVDPDLARVARDRYGCLTPWATDPAAYGRAALTGSYRDCRNEVVAMLADLMRRRSDYVARDGARFFDAARNAALVANAERYYKVMYYGSRASWNLRDDHMFETLETILAHHGPAARAVVWAHNSHVGDARATEMGRRGERNIGELCARGFGRDSYRIGFGTDRGTVAAATDWDTPMEVMHVRPAHENSYERQFHLAGLPGLILPMRAGSELDVATALSHPRLERAIGVIYRPDTELQSHYFEAELPRQFNEYIWIDQTEAVRPIETGRLAGMPDTYPFGT
ncbi:protein-L-isoaspartate O-methyltransferase [Roseibacterium sp. SDUM158017]|uniref:protein-L-isoaspartate O-methyltransferase n=1 Tax=Roseicyclus salinarum TaxID=3036773 RepID=UPI0024153E63|nr:protein-L-isoaspartate O-methyltransferase [Roseibacterium sp. SDUM158017]MDG4647794.1 protein-L-isoaspartate O-methyltransferase [Roseibacterium sp. SDUM158017]